MNCSIPDSPPRNRFNDPTHRGPGEDPDLEPSRELIDWIFANEPESDEELEGLIEAFKRRSQPPAPPPHWKVFRVEVTMWPNLPPCIWFMRRRRGPDGRFTFNSHMHISSFEPRSKRLLRQLCELVWSGLLSSPAFELTSTNGFEAIWRRLEISQGETDSSTEDNS